MPKMRHILNDFVFFWKNYKNLKYIFLLLKRLTIGSLSSGQKFIQKRLLIEQI